jgi:hypothetical protein
LKRSRLQISLTAGDITEDKSIDEKPVTTSRVGIKRVGLYRELILNVRVMSRCMLGEIIAKQIDEQRILHHAAPYM